jgi:hypothetical protein
MLRRNLIYYFEQAEAIRVLVASLRKKIEPDPSNPKYLTTEPWIGYRFTSLVLLLYEGGLVDVKRLTGGTFNFYFKLLLPGRSQITGRPDTRLIPANNQILHKSSKNCIK